MLKKNLVYMKVWLFIGLLFFILSLAASLFFKFHLLFGLILYTTLLSIGFFMIHKSIIKKYKKNNYLFKKAFDYSTEALVVLNQEKQLIKVNDTFFTLTGFSEKEALEHSVEWLLDGEKNAERYYSLEQKLKTDGYWKGERWIKSKNKKACLTKLSIHVCRSITLNTAYYIILFSDITPLKQAKDELLYLTRYDALTSLPNRNWFSKRLASSFQIAHRNHQCLALILFSLDNFKILNDLYGPIIGEKLLKVVINRLTHIIDHRDFIARIATDELALIIKNMTSKPQLLSMVNKIINTMAKSVHIESELISLHTSIGISLFPEDAKESQALFTHASIALNYAKWIGNTDYLFYTAEMSNIVQTKQKLESLLRKALEEEELVLFYQPIVNAKTGHIVGVEALLRWFNDSIGWVPSSEFIPIAEKMGLIVDIGQWVLKTACQQLKQWQQIGFEHLKVAINLSAHQFEFGELVRMVSRISAQIDIDPQSIELEITESILMKNIEKSVLKLKVLKSMGVSISIDDFGTGYSSLNYLHQFPIDTIKIDKSFIHNIFSKHESPCIIEAIITMAKELNIKTIVEGVESLDQIEYLIEKQVDALQGYYFSAPIDSLKMEAFLQEEIKKIKFKKYS